MNLNLKLVGVSILLAAGLSACDKPAVKDAGAEKIEVKTANASPAAGTTDKVVATPSEKTANTTDEIETANKVKSIIVADLGPKLQKISVETEKGVVTMTGFVDSEASRNRAKELATEVPGVTRVDNRLVPKSDNR